MNDQCCRLKVNAQIRYVDFQKRTIKAHKKKNFNQHRKLAAKSVSKDKSSKPVYISNYFLIIFRSLNCFLNYSHQL